MGYLKLDFRIIIFTFAILLTSCSEDTKRDIYFVLDMAGVLVPSETRIDLPLKNEQTEEVFSFQDYCKEEYDSMFLVYPYFNIEKKDFLNLKMSNKLRRKCDNNTNFDSFSTASISENALTVPLLIKRSVENESKLELLLHTLLNLSDIFKLTKSSFSVLKYG